MTTSLDDGQQQDEPLTITRPAPRRPKPKRYVNQPLIVVVTAVLAMAGATAYVMLQPHSALVDSMNGATPSLSEARTCLRDRDFACAEADYRAYLRKYPKDASATGILAITLTQDGQHQDALPYYKRAVSLGVSTYDLYANYAVSLNNTGQVDEAIKQNYAALKLVPSLVDVRGALADQLVRKGRGKEALGLLEAFDQSLQDQGQPAYFTTQIAQIRTKLGLATPAVQLATSSNAPSVAPGGRTEIPLEANHGALYAPVVLDGAMTLKFVVDSGASDVVIPADVARTLMRMGKLTRADTRGYGVAELADGSRVPAERVVLHSIRVGGHEVTDVLASVTTAQGSLLLGQSFLRRFKSWSIDNGRRVLILQG